MIDVRDNGKIPDAALQILAHSIRNQFIILADPQVVKEYSPHYNPHNPRIADRPDGSDHRRTRTASPWASPTHEGPVPHEPARRMGPHLPLAPLHPDAGMGTREPRHHRAGRRVLPDRYRRKKISGRRVVSVGQSPWTPTPQTRPADPESTQED